MSDISRSVSVTISRETQAVSKAGFGVPAIIAKFLTTDTTVLFDRARAYADIDEVSADGWAATSDVYKAFNALFGQPVKVAQAILGRWVADEESPASVIKAIKLQ